MTPAFRAAKDVGVVMPADGEHVFLAHLPNGPLLVLEGVAATIWTEATTGPERGWVGRVASVFEETEKDVAADVRQFVADLEARGILEPATDQPAEVPDAR